MSEIGFQVTSYSHANRGDLYDFQFILPLYGEFSGRAKACWRQPIPNSPNNYKIGFQYDKLSWSMRKKVKEITKSPEILNKINEIKRYG